MCKDNILSLDNPIVMGILNITPDSFFGGSRVSSHNDLISRAEVMISEGAEILDIGGCSTRPGAEVVTLQEELNRVIPAIQSIAKTFPEIKISVDTFRSEVAKKAISAGAIIVNDISGGTFDPEMIDFVAKNSVVYVMMHTPAMPNEMQLNPNYESVVKDVYSFFEKQLELYKSKGGNINNVWLDPGFGFGKTLNHNYEILASLKNFSDFGSEILVGISRKSMINKVLHCTADDALNGTTVINTLALQNGAKILRVHDVRQAAETILLFNKYNSFC